MHMDRDVFYQTLFTYLTASQPIRSRSHLKGRADDLKRLTSALLSPGRHAFIFGFRGVGKTSLAQTALFGIQAEHGKSPILASCERNSTFLSVMTDVIRQMADLNPIEVKQATVVGANGNLLGFGASATKTLTRLDDNFRPNDVGEVIAALEYVCATRMTSFVILIDEFDVLENQYEHERFAALLKQVSDRRIDVKFIICGVADSVERMFTSHASLSRQMHTEEVHQLGWQPRFDIIDDAAAALQLTVDFNIKSRIAAVSDGFPSFVHLVSEQVFSTAFEMGKDYVTSEAFQKGVNLAVTSVDRPLRKEYEDAIRKNTTKSEPVLWAVAADKHFEINVDQAWKHYIDIIEMMSEKNPDDQEIAPISKANFNTKLNSLCKPAYGLLLEKPRRANYTFREKRMRAYARLRAEQASCQIGYDSIGPSVV